ncbi:MAG TPA: dihydropteroate synthase, partial [Paracoccus sp. (in: a-proteobacteria)]|nr:dihydropteroate synthase [Paracoccus sp. (in: a-proteobacteria)]
DEEWKSLSVALEQRNLPAVVASRLRPWYVAVMLGMSPCMLRIVEERGDAGGLDHLLIARAEAAGICRTRIVIDPGIGFGKTQAHNLAILRRISVYHGLGCAVLLGVSR